MENNEFRGLNDGIILYVLKSGDRHTDELKTIIDETFFEIKVGTLYSVITRLKNLKYVDEYRSSSNGSRRKYFSITGDGVTFFANNYGEKFKNAPKIEERVERTPVVEPTEKREKKKPATPEVDYENYVKNVQNDEYVNQENEIDFTKITDFENFNLNETTQVQQQVVETVQAVEIAPTVEVVTEIEQKPTPSVNPEIPAYVPPERPARREIDYDSVNDTSFEYKSVLTTLFPRNNATNQSFSVYQPYEEAVQQEISVIKEYNTTETTADFDDIYSFAEKDGIKIRTSSDTNRYEGSKILHNLLRFHTSIGWYALLIIEFLLLSLFVSNLVAFDGAIFGKLCLFTAVVPVISTIIYFTNTRYSVKDLPRFKEVIEISLIIAISAIIIIIALSSIREINYQDFNALYNNVIIPILVAVNVPLFYVIKYFLSKLDYYQTI